MAADWPRVRIDFIAEKVAMGPFGSSIKVETFVPRGVPVISGQHLRGYAVDDSVGFNFISFDHADRLSSANVRRGDVVFTHAGNIGQVAVIPENSEYDRYVLSQRQFYMRCDRSKVVPAFVVAYFKTPEGRHQLLANAAQVGVPSLARPVTYLKTIEIPLPPLPIQRRITDVLASLDDKIELNRRMSETLESMARALFRSWFVDFDPVHAKANGRDTGLPKLIADLFSDRLVDSELGDIPAGWIATRWGNLLTLEYGRSLRSYGTADGQYPVFGTNGQIGTCEMALCSHPGIVIGRKGAYRGVQFSPSPFYVIDTAFYVEPKSDIDLRWAYYEMLRRDLNEMDSGSAIPSTSRDDFYAIRVVAPPAPVQEAFVHLLTAGWARQEQLVDASRTLAAVRDALLPKLISGEIRVPEAERMLETAPQ